jgi:hypothetical protein
VGLASRLEVSAEVNINRHSKDELNKNALSLSEDVDFRVVHMQ